MKSLIKIATLLMVVAFASGAFAAGQDGRQTFTDWSAYWAERSAERMEGVVNVNTAGIEALAQLPGFDHEIAANILAYRDANGPLDSIEELLGVKGVTLKGLSRMEENLAVSGESNLRRADTYPYPQLEVGF